MRPSEGQQDGPAGSPCRPVLRILPTPALAAGAVQALGWAAMTAPVSIAHAALVCGCSENALRRWIASGKLSAERVDDKYLVCPADVARLVADVPALESAPGTAGGPVQEVDPDARTDDEDARPVGPPGTDIMRAEAMTAYTRSLLEPLLALVQQQGTTIREQAETI